jgi:signal transduction histidine kinase
MDTLAPPRRQLWPAHWIAIDCASTALILLVYIDLKVAPFLRGIPSWAAIVIVLVAVVPAAFRRCGPRTVLVMVAASEAVASALSSSPAPPLAVAFVMYLIPLRFPRRDALWLLAGTLLVTAVGLAAFAMIPHAHGPETGTIGKAAGLLLEDALLVTVAWLIGYSVRQQRGQAADRREQAERRAREQLAEGRRAKSEERLQISRELHDLVAHTLSVIAVQAGVAGYVLGERPEEAARALSSIEQTSRSALHEMRVLLGVLRDGETGARNGAGPGTRDAALVPAPGLADLDTLVERTGEAGVRVELSVRGERPRLPAGLDLAAYRVIQEAVQRHQARGHRPVPGDRRLPGEHADARGERQRRRRSRERRWRAAGRRQRHHRNAGAECGSGPRCTAGTSGPPRCRDAVSGSPPGSRSQTQNSQALRSRTAGR